ncbi:hypothetical protein INT47_010970 [Mucor saturninus]|uniref:SWIM-type domain-containing protein n=1 Tax=Mucor saturninus TaxID=64648 RepID=A0A8H7QFL5_9FUNG|nr:hypothetical protein INT47_010970 [Mucor saturninus]
MSNNTIIYNISNIQNALINSSIEGIKMLPLNTTISVKANEWEQCLSRMNTLCSTKWTVNRKLQDQSLVFRETRQCHRSGKYQPKRQIRLAQKDSKRCGCTAALKIKQYNDTSIVTFCMTKDHVNHVPGERQEIRTLPLPSEAIKIIEDQLRSGSSCRNTRISTLRQIENWGVGIRKPNYEEIYNRMKKMETLLYMFNSNEKTSLSIWLNEKLASQNYSIFIGNLLAYSTNQDLFAFGFQSPTQVQIMSLSQSFCLDATHRVSCRSTEVMYSLVTKHPETGKGYPLVYLRQTNPFNPLAITIDCCIAEANAITSALPQTSIHYCEFHVLRAWQHNLDSKVKLDGSFTTQQLAEYKQSLKNSLKSILVESNEAIFITKIGEFKRMIQDQPEFLRYFERKWTGSENILRRWGRPFVQQHHQRYLTNNYIESWHNQLKVIYFNRARIRRLDRLVFILTNDVEFYYEQEVERLNFSNGRMGPVENELSRNSFAASQIQDDILPSMIINPLGEISNSMDDSNGEWQIQSFSTENQWYTVLIEQGLIQKCSCPSFYRRQLPCKHMYLLKQYSRANLVYHEQQDHTHMQLQQSAQSVRNEALVDNNIEQTNELQDPSSIIQSISANAATLYHQREDLERLRSIPGVDIAKLEIIDRLLFDALKHIDNLKNENSLYFQNINTQR